MIQESGRSMIEMVGVLAIMGMLTATAFALISLGINRQKQARVMDDVVTIVSGVRGLLGDYDDFSNIDNFAAMSVSSKNPYGGTYELSVDPYDARQFIIRINGLNKSDCEALVTKAWTGSIGYNSSNHKESGATGNCADGNNNVVSITYGE